MTTNNYSKPSIHQLEVSLFGPGYGESVIIHLGFNKRVIIDSCINTESKENVAIEYLKRIGADLDTDVIFLICTHWHDDHVKGFHELVERCSSARVCTMLLIPSIVY